ncbi:MAG: hypothetical protein K6E32_02595 [Lachnospiraceae bacterium]|nr:hypothetical protein [Lachnospiraceae bacterium]
MLGKLVAIRMTSIFREKRDDGKKKRNVGLLYACLAIYMALVFGFLFWNTFGTLFSAYCGEAQLDWLYFAMAASMAAMLGFIGSVFITQNQLFEAKDNELLLSMPIKPSVILVSRLLTLYAWSFFFGAVSSIPAFVVYFSNKELAPLGIAAFVAELFLVPLLALTVSILAAWVLQFFSRFVKHKSLFVIIGTFVFLGLYMYVVNKLMDFTDYLAEHGTEMGNLFKSRLLPFYACGTAVSDPGPVPLALMLAITLLPFCILFFVLSKTFVNLITTKKGYAKVKYKAGKLKVTDPVSAVCRKEMLRFVKSSAYAVNGGTGLLMQIVLAVLISLKGDMFFTILTSMMGEERGTAAAVTLIIVLVAFSAIITEITICSISMEGKMLWILKSAPVSSLDILKAKIRAHLYMAVPFAAVAGIVLNIFLPLNPIQRVMAVVLPVTLQVFNAYFGLAVNLKYPKLDWVNEAYAVKQSTAANIGALGGMGTVIVAAIAAMLLGNYIPYDLVLVLMTALLLLGILYYMFKYLPGKGVKRFEEL